MISLEDLDCSICLQMIIEPVRLDVCKHFFCKTCLDDLIDFSL